MAIDTKLRDELSNLSAKEAAEIIDTEFGLGMFKFKFILTGHNSSPRIIAKQKGASRISAEEISPIKFWGGPPNDRKFHRGTLLTWLCDLVLYNWVSHGTYADMVTDAEFQTT